MSGSKAFIPAEADQLEAMIVNLNASESDIVWKEYEDRGFDAAQLVAQHYTSAFKARYKVTEAAPVATEKWAQAGAPPSLLRQEKKPKFNAASDYFAKAMGADQAKKR